MQPEQELDRKLLGAVINFGLAFKHIKLDVFKMALHLHALLGDRV